MNENVEDGGLEQIRARLNALAAQVDNVPQGKPETTHQALEEAQDLLELLYATQADLVRQNEALQQANLILEADERLFRDLFDLAPDGYLVTDEHGVIEAANETAGRLLGVKPNFLTGKPLALFVAEKDVGDFRTWILSNPEAAPQTREFIVKPRQGEGFPAELSVEARENRGRNLVWRLRDLRETKRVQAEVEAAYGRLEKIIAEGTAELTQKNKELQDFAFIASHDLQEPVRKVNTFGKLLFDKLRERLEPEEVDFFERLLRAGGRLNEMMAGLLTYSRVTTRAHPLELVELDQALEEALEDLDYIIDREHPQIQHEPLPAVRADPNQMRMVFFNLLSNALKFHHPGEPPVIRVWSGANASNGVIIYVQDQGIGFDMKFAEQVFLPFKRLNRMNEFEGSGMGLAICHKIIERHGGEITVESRRGEGTTFTIHLPENNQP